MYHMHIAIVFNDRFLCTSRDNDLQKCEIFLGYFGKMRFMDTWPIKWDPQILDSLSESDDSFEILPIPRRNQIKPRVPKPAKNPRPAAKPTSRQLALLFKKKDEENLKNSKTTEDPKTEKDIENENNSKTVEDTKTDKDSENKKENEQSTGNAKNFATKNPSSKFGRTPKSSNVITTNKGNISISKDDEEKLLGSSLALGVLKHLNNCNSSKLMSRIHKKM